MRVTFIDTDSVWAWGSRMLSSVLKQAGHEARLLLMDTGDARYTAEDLRELDSFVRDAGLVGVSCHSRGSDKAQQVLRYLKSQGVLTVWGGIHATLNPEECAEFADMVCIGEGEGAIVDLASRVERQVDWRDVLNIGFKDKGNFIRNSLRPMAKMDDLPTLDFSCSDEFQFLDHHFVRRSQSRDLAMEEIPFLGSRGCAFQCTYCCNAKLRQIYAGTGRYVRKHSVSAFVDRAATLRGHFPNGKRLFFVDDDFLDRSMDELQEFATTYPKAVGLPFECQVSPMRVNEQRVELLAKAGVWRIRMGVESGSERTKKEVYRRAMPNEAVVRASETLVRYPHIVRAYYFIVGNPFENTADLVETIRLILRIPPPYFVQVFNLVFFPGSVLYEQAVAVGLISGKKDSGYDLHYRGGLQYRGHVWKLKNLYLNALLYLMEGKVTKVRIGLLPRFLVLPLTHSRFVGLNERHLGFAKTMIAIKRVMLDLRGRVSKLLQQIIPNKEFFYSPRVFLMTRVGRLFGSARSY